jgi:hypothetical protein
VVRTIQPGPETGIEHSFSILARGDVNRPQSTNSGDRYGIPVDTSVKHAYSSMAGAPAINGTSAP